MAPEINGAVNTTYTSMSEHLLIYHVQMFENPTTMPRANKEMHGTKADIQNKLIEFLFNLKYYSTRWLRAKQFAEMIGLMTKSDESGIKHKVRNDKTWKP